MRLSYQEFIEAFSRLSLVWAPGEIGRAFDSFFEFAVPKLREVLAQN